MNGELIMNINSKRKGKNELFANSFTTQLFNIDLLELFELLELLEFRLCTEKNLMDDEPKMNNR